MSEKSERPRCKRKPGLFFVVWVVSVAQNSLAQLSLQRGVVLWVGVHNVRLVSKRSFSTTVFFQRRRVLLCYFYAVQFGRHVEKIKERLPSAIHVSKAVWVAIWLAEPPCTVLVKRYTRTATQRLVQFFETHWVILEPLSAQSITSGLIINRRANINSSIYGRDMLEFWGVTMQLDMHVCFQILYFPTNFRWRIMPNFWFWQWESWKIFEIQGLSTTWWKVKLASELPLHVSWKYQLGYTKD